MPEAETEKPQKRKIAESDSDDDVPLSELRNRIAVKKEPTSPKLIKKPESQVSSTVTVKSEPKTLSQPVTGASNEDSDDSDDDVPIAVLMKRKQEAALAAKKAAKSPAKKAKVAETTSKKTSTPEKKKTVSSSKKASTISSSRSSSSSTSGPAKKLKGDPLKSSELTERFYSTLDKGKLCQRLLCRWWYAMSWPQEGVMDLCPIGYEPLHGFPGVFVGTTTNFIGNIVDKRDQETCPNLRNFSRKSSAELKELCVQAYEEQIRQLVEAEGANTKLERMLKKELREIKDIKTDRADKQAEKLLKQPF